MQPDDGNRFLEEAEAMIGISNAMDEPDNMRVKSNTGESLHALSFKTL